MTRRATRIERLKALAAPEGLDILPINATRCCVVLRAPPMHRAIDGGAFVAVGEFFRTPTHAALEKVWAQELERFKVRPVRAAVRYYLG